MSDTVCIHCYVSGKVQGVFFRTNTKTQAEHLSITGWVRNLEDGRVEVLACGPRENIEDFHEWLKKGPPKAVVEEINCELVSWQEYKRFEIVY